MAATIVQFNGLTGMTFTLKLFVENADTIQNGSGDLCTQRTNNIGQYTATVAEALAGTYDALITDASGNLVHRYKVDLLDDTNTHICYEPNLDNVLLQARNAAVNTQS